MFLFILIDLDLVRDITSDNKVALDAARAVRGRLVQETVRELATLIQSIDSKTVGTDLKGLLGNPDLLPEQCDTSYSVQCIEYLRETWRTPIQ